MRAVVLVLLALVAGAAIGIGLYQASRPPPASATPAVAPATVLFPPQTSTPELAANPATARDGPGVSAEYRRLAEALLMVDERIAAMEEQVAKSMEQQRALADELRAMAMQLEIRSGQMRPLRDVPQALTPVKNLPEAEAISPGIRPLPRGPVPPAPGHTPAAKTPRADAADGERLPEW